MIHIGIAGWTHVSLHGKGGFYPQGILPGDRLNHYGKAFSIVEAASTFFEIPSADKVQLWVERSPAELVFHFQAPAMLMGYPVAPKSLPGIIARELGRDMLDSGQIKSFPREVTEMAFDMFIASLRPVRDAGKMGAVIYRFPAWFAPVRESYAYLDMVYEKTWGLCSAVEFQHAGWLIQPGMGQAIAFLKQRKMAFIASDSHNIRGFQGPGALTAPFAYVRFGGRKKGQRFLYSQRDLTPWVYRVLRADSKVKDVYVLFASRQGMDSVLNARLFRTMLKMEGGEGSVKSQRQAVD
ncbi:MAG: DUF72 domain-containing protein [Desulfatibacillum sp.]|nr:DUF72 domain-containing protein [Desulfatibacillum sp.]